MIATDPLDTLMRKLALRDDMSPSERHALAAEAGDVEVRDAGTDLVTEGDRPSHSTLIVDGFSCRYRMLRDGERQITAIHVPGDFVDLHSFPMKVMDHSVGVLTTCRIVRFPHEGLDRITRQFPHMTRLLWLMTLLDGAISREWIVAMGRRSAQDRMAHLLCELNTRLEVVGLSQNNTFQLPLTQTHFADMLGLSLVHMNRVVQQLRADDLVSWQNQTLKILDWQRLTDIAEFDPTYLHLEHLRR
ncbi:Crp/Fnr family transcriptional regulator [Devosia sp.]|uniref:Crp/Fnr family transcriptional regulator n=1 Tax=Devosia sp. TaxID=1871048 RepID=UPI003A93F4B6